MEKSPFSVDYYLDACRAYLCSKAGSNKKNLFTQFKEKKSHRNKAAEVTQTPACRKDVMVGSRRPTGFMGDIF